MDEQPHFASYKLVEEVSRSNHVMFVWPDEGDFTDGKWKFNGKHKGKHKGEFEPLIIDRTTARMLVLVHDALGQANQEKFERWVAADRGYFAWLVGFGWAHTRPTVATK